MSQRQRLLGTLPRAVCIISSTVVGLAVLSWSASPHAEEIQESEAPTITIAPPRKTLSVGERLNFHGRWFGIPVGHGWIEIKEIVTLNGRRAYHIEAEGHSNDFLATFYPLHDVLRSYLDVETLQPLQSEKYQREGHYRAEEIVTFDYERKIATYRSLLHQSVKEVPIPSDVHDLLGAFYWLRLQPVDPGHPITVDIYSDEKVYHTQVNPLKTVTLELLWRGTFPCLLIEPLATFKGILVRRGRVWIYVSADERRLPLFIKIATLWGPITGVIDLESLRAAGLNRHPVGSP